MRARLQLGADAPRADATVRARFQLAADAPVVPTPPYMPGSRSSTHESRITNHGSSGRFDRDQSLCYDDRWLRSMD
ncbi:MAG: hypothetical protein OXF76_06020 [Caldilineaceae bacterium]|nr:hypothetical protein [Caldilineaceae bacterium]